MIEVCNHRAYANLIDLTADSSDDGGSEDTAIPGVPFNTKCRVCQTFCH